MDFITTINNFLLSYRTEIMDELHYSHTYWIFLLPLVMIATDVVSGWIQATINSTWDSTKMRKGLFRKGGEMLVVVVVATYVLTDVDKYTGKCTFNPEALRTTQGRSPVTKIEYVRVFYGGKYNQVMGDYVDSGVVV